MAFWDNIRFPYFNMQELNLDWIMKELKMIAGFMPQDGNVGDILTRKSEGAAWEPPEAVNININGLPEDTEIGDNDQLIFYDISAQANRRIKPPNLLDSMMSNGTPLMDGTASPGTSKKPARYDHKHPTDTTRAPASYFQNQHLKVENGGTGAGNASDARTNLGITSYQWNRITIPGNDSATLNFANYESGVFFFVGYNANSMGLYILTRNNVTLVNKVIADASNLTISMDSDGVISFANSTATVIYAFWCKTTGN